MKILMVCLGNICRSPLAEGILKHKVKERNLDWHIDSAGTSSWHTGELPDQRSIRTAQEHGIDITDQKARQLSKQDIESYDLILAMDSSNYNDIQKLVGDESESDKVKLVMNFAKPGFNQSVPDPYWDDDGFEKVFQMLDKACDKIIEKYSTQKV